MNKNKKNKNKKVNEAISNMGDTASFEKLNSIENKANKIHSDVKSHIENTNY
jgi:hypothetical protein